MDYDKSRRHKSSTSKKRQHFNSDNKKRKRLNLRHDDWSVSSKPIETIYRILCPVKKIGSVLGRGGDIITAIREETRAKIRVIDAIPGAEERVIIIFNYQNQSGELDSDEAAENISNADGSQYMKPHCPAQDALLKIHDRIAADDVLHGSAGGVVQEKAEPGDAVTARILVPSNQVGCLLGKGGTIIQQLRSATGAGIRVLPSDHLPSCAMKTDELVQISGTPPLVRKALYEISTRLHQHPHKENPPLEEIIHASTQRVRESPPPLHHGNPSWLPQDGEPPAPMPWFDTYRNEPPRRAPVGPIASLAEAEEFSFKVLCATGRIGGVIGKSGATVRQLEQQTGARIQVEDSDADVGERIIVVSSNEIPTDPISPTIEALLLLQSKISTVSEKGHLTTRLLIPSSKVGCILGEGGKIITEMRRRSGAEIRVFSKADKPKYVPVDEELVQVGGPPTIARGALIEIASRLRTRTFRIGNIADNLPPPAPFHGLPPVDVLPSREFPPYGRPANHPPYGRPASNLPHDPLPRYPPTDYVPMREYPPNGSPSYIKDGPLVASNRGYAGPDHLSGRELPSASPANNNASTHPYGYAPPESYVNRGVQQLGLSGAGNSTAYDFMEAAGQTHESEGYQGLAGGATGYPTSSVEVRIPNSALGSVIGVGGSNLSEIRQISGARVKLHDASMGSSECIVEIHGTPDQMKAAQSLLQASVVMNGQNVKPPQPSIPYQYSGWS